MIASYFSRYTSVSVLYTHSFGFVRKVEPNVSFHLRCNLWWSSVRAEYPADTSRCQSLSEKGKGTKSKQGRLCTVIYIPKPAPRPHSIHGPPISFVSSSGTGLWYEC
ncbi:hypothetical protein DL95DRAFT_67494 [Leptodontidium sp. 2 PMI_412]|nr:hypothetical protein DL95DRAFT_67494 [Leptodontidium sp. 2 PMI_412]